MKDCKVAPITHPGTKDERVLSFLARCQAAPRWPDLLIAIALALPVPLLVALMPRVMVNYTHHDLFIPLDSAWRTLHGQWPHTDYYTPLGLSYAWMNGGAAWLFGTDGHVPDRAGLLALPFVLGPALLLAWRRLDVMSTVLLAVFLGVLVTSPVFLDGPERLIAHLAGYNRVGGGLCAAACLWGLARPSLPSARRDVVEATAMAVVYVILLYLKVTFFALAALTALVGCISRTLPWSRAVLAAALAVLGVVGLELLHPGLSTAYLGDIRRAGAANTELFRSFYTPQALLVNLPLGLLIGVLGAMAAWLAPGGWSNGDRWRIAGIFVVACACVLASTQNFGAFSAPMVVLVMLVGRRMALAGEAGPSGPVPASHATCGPALRVLALAAALLAVGPFLVTQLAGIAYQFTQRPSNGVVVGGGRSDVLQAVVWMPNPIERAFMPEDATPEEAGRWQAQLPVQVAAAVLADGLDLLRREGLEGRRIENLSFSNPFPVLLRAPPPRGVALWWDENRTFTTALLRPGQAVGDADVVMVPHLWWQQQITTALLRVAQPELERGFTPRESRYWTAWVRKP